MEIPLSAKAGAGKFAIVDAVDYALVAPFKWYYNTLGYAWRSVKVEGRWTSILMHRQILDPSPIAWVDHIDGNGLNNSRANLRLADKQTNSWNRRGQSVSTSQFKGVRMKKRNYGASWEAKITMDGVAYYLGTFKSEIEAARAYDAKALELFGEFARLNGV